VSIEGRECESTRVWGGAQLRCVLCFVFCARTMGSESEVENIRSAAASVAWSVHPEKVFFRRNTKTSGSCLHINKVVRTNFNTKLYHNHNAKPYSF
jgi:hypothetical protein